MKNHQSLNSYFTILAILLTLLHLASGQVYFCGQSSGGVDYDVNVVVDIPKTTYIYECQRTTLYLAKANVTIWGRDSNGNDAVIYRFCPCETQLTVTPNTGVNFQVSQNTCRNLVAGDYTVSNCQWVFEAFRPNLGINYEEMAASSFEYSARIRFRGRFPECAYEIMNDVTVYVKDCNEVPVFSNEIPAQVNLAEYVGPGTAYAGTILNLLVTDPDTFNTVWGNVSLSIQSIQSNLGKAIDPTPFYIEGGSFTHTNNNQTALRYDVSRCVNVAKCLEMFDAGTGAAHILTFTILAIDGGGLRATQTIDVVLDRVAREPVFLNLPNTIQVAEEKLVPGADEQIFMMQMTIDRIITPTSWSIQVIDVQPPVNTAGGTYVTNGTGACAPAPAGPVLCAPLSLTNLVDGTAFDYSSVQKYNVTVWGIHVAGVSGMVSKTISSYVTIEIIPKNLQPVLVPEKDIITVTEDAAKQDCIYNLSSIPQDPNNDTVFYYTPGTVTVADASTVAMWYQNGSLICYNGNFASVGTCCDRVFRDTSSPYEIPVIIRDPYTTPTPYPTFTLTVVIVKIDNPPILNAPLILSVPETWRNFTFEVNATQDYPLDTTSVLLFDAIPFSSMYNDAFFFIDNYNSTRNLGFATIGVSGPGPYYFDYLTYPILFVNITVTDGIYTTVGTVKIYVEFVNRKPSATNLPVNLELPEDTTGFAPFFTVSSTDRESDPVKFQFYTASNTLSQIDHTWFSIDYNLGIIYYVNPSFDWYATEVYTLAVLLQDYPNSLPYKNATYLFNMTITIMRVNQAPNFTNPYAGTGMPNSTIQIREDATGQAFVYQFNATDREGDVIYYNVTGMSPVTNTAFNLAWGSYELEYNELYASSLPMFNNSVVSVYLIVLEAKDIYHMENATSTTTLTVSIIWVNRTARWTSLPGVLSIREDVTYGPTDIYHIGVVDPNNNNSALVPTFIGIIPSNGTGKFGFDSSTMMLYYVQNPGFSYADFNSFSALFEAHNGFDPTVTSNVAINILKVNQGPYTNFSTYNHDVTMYENVTTSRLLWDLRTLSNQSLSLSYALEDSSPPSNAFTVTSNGLVQLQNNPGFNYQVASRYIVHILAIDAGLGGNQQAMTATYTLTVSILPVAGKPIITNLPNYARIQEGAPGANTLYTAECIDPAGRALTWTYQVFPPSGLSYFAVYNNGTMATTTSANFTYLLDPKYRLVGYCTNGEKTASGTLTIAITWTTTTSTTTTTPLPTVIVTQSTTTEESTGLTWEQIAAICGSLFGALILAGIAFGVAQYLQRKANKKGLTAKMRRPQAAAAMSNVYLR